MTAYFSLSEVADKLRLREHMKWPERWLMAQIAKGRIPGRKVGRKVLMSEEDIAAANETFLIGRKTREVEAAKPSDPVGLSAASRRRRLQVAS